MAKIIQIYTDDLGYGDLACYGNAVCHSDNIDAMATAGARFTEFHVASPVCSPSRTGLITGIYPQYLGMWDADVPERTVRYYLPIGTPTIAKRLKVAELTEGLPFYHTAHFGKWHLGEPPFTQLPTQFGFDYFFGNPGGRPSSSWLSYSRYADPQMAEITPAVIGAMTTRIGWADQIPVDRCIEWLDEDNGNGKPREGNFYIHIWMYMPHEPLTLNLPADVLALYGTSGQKAYYGPITMGDRAIGDLVAALDSWNILGDTYIMFASDNGPEVGGFSIGTAAPLKGNKTTLWQGGVCVPMIMRGPGITPASTDTGVRSALDWVPTVLDIVGAAADPLLVGSSLLNAAPARELFWRHVKTQRGVTSSGRACRQGQWKYLGTAGAPQLYDLSTDPGETTNVHATNTAKRDELEAALAAWEATFPLGSAGSGSVVGNPATEAEANIIAASPLGIIRYARPGTIGEAITLETDLNTLLGLPRSVPCPHGSDPVNETSYGTVRATHPTYGNTSVVFNDGIEKALNVSTNRSNCSAGQLANLDDRIRNGFGRPQS